MNIFLIVAQTFWLSVCLAPALAVLGVLLRWWPLLIISAIVSLPFSIYMVSSPLLRVFGLLPFVHLVAAFALTTNMRWVHWLLLAAIFAAFIWFWLWRLCYIRIGGFTDPCPPLF